MTKRLELALGFNMYLPGRPYASENYQVIVPIDVTKINIKIKLIQFVRHMPQRTVRSLSYVISQAIEFDSLQNNAFENSLIEFVRFKQSNGERPI